MEIRQRLHLGSEVSHKYEKDLREVQAAAVRDNQFDDTTVRIHNMLRDAVCISITRVKKKYGVEKKITTAKGNLKFQTKVGPFFLSLSL
jgi:hypothetical protein